MKYPDRRKLRSSVLQQSFNHFASGNREAPLEPKRTWKERVLQEVKNLAAVLVYLWVFLTMFELHEGIVLSRHNIPYNYAEGLVFALVNAWILAKFVVIGEGLGIGRRWHSKPLWQSILVKSAVFGIILMGCHLAEKALSRMWRAKSFAAGVPVWSVNAVTDGLTLTLIIFIVLIPFFTAREFRRILGKDLLQAALLRRENTTTLPSVHSRELPAKS